jgi:type III pantothenate kinase
MQGAVDTYRKRYKTLRVVLTGGDWLYFANQLKNPIFVAPELTLLGLNYILNYNHSGDF